MNRERLAQLIYWKRSFTEDELIRTFEPSASDKTETAPRRLLREYLESLKLLGLLRFDGERYTLLNPAKNRTTVAG
jgi:hypothetical protein